MKCPQLSKPEATAARNQNSIGDRTEKKPWEKPGSVGGPFLLWPDDTAVQLQLLQVCLQVSSVKISLSPLCVLFSDNWIPLSILGISWSLISSITSAMHMWSFCARAPSGFQYELNSHYITCVLGNAHNTLFWVKIGKIILFSKETGFPELSSLILLSQ